MPTTRARRRYGVAKNATRHQVSSQREEPPFPPKRRSRAARAPLTPQCLPPKARSSDTTVPPFESSHCLGGLTLPPKPLFSFLFFFIPKIQIQLNWRGIKNGQRDEPGRALREGLHVEANGLFREAQGGGGRRAGGELSRHRMGARGASTPRLWRSLGTRGDAGHAHGCICVDAPGQAAGKCRGSARGPLPALASSRRGHLLQVPRSAERGRPSSRRHEFKGAQPRDGRVATRCLSIFGGRRP